MRKTLLGIVMSALILGGLSIGYKAVIFKNAISFYDIKRCEAKIKHSIEFTFENDMFDKERNFVKNYYLSKHGETISELRAGEPYDPGLDRVDVGIGLHDLSGNGEQDLFALVRAYGVCVSSGCDVILFKSEKGKYTNLLEEKRSEIKAHNIHILKSRTDGMHDIAFGICPEISTWVWDKARQEYKYKEGRANYGVPHEW